MERLSQTTQQPDSYYYFSAVNDKCRSEANVGCGLENTASISFLMAYVQGLCCQTLVFAVFGWVHTAVQSGSQQGSGASLFNVSGLNSDLKMHRTLVHFAPEMYEPVSCQTQSPIT